MLKNFLKVALRNMWKQKGYSFLNIFGLAIGMTCSLLILLWIWDEKSMDNFHVNGSRLYSIYERQFYDGKIDAGYYTPGLLPEQMKKVLPEVELATGFTWFEKTTWQVGDKILKEQGRNASADFFRMFSYPLVQGTPATALATPVSLAISRKMANEFFGSPQAAIGQAMRFQNKRNSRSPPFSKTCPRTPPINSTISSTGPRGWTIMPGQRSGVTTVPRLLSCCARTPIPLPLPKRSPISWMRITKNRTRIFG